jgi:hypothetical protein
MKAVGAAQRDEQASAASGGRRRVRRDVGAGPTHDISGAEGSLASSDETGAFRRRARPAAHRPLGEKEHSGTGPLVRNRRRQREPTAGGVRSPLPSGGSTSGSPCQTAVALPLPAWKRRSGSGVVGARYMVVVARIWHASALAAHLWCGVGCRPRAVRDPMQVSGAGYVDFLAPFGAVASRRLDVLKGDPS